MSQRDDFENFLHLPQYKLSSPISQLWHMQKVVSLSVNHIIILYKYGHAWIILRTVRDVSMLIL